MDDHEAIRRLRHLRGYKQAHLADQLGITIKAYSKLENGQTQLTVRRLRQVAGILGVRPEQILCFSEVQLFSS